MRTLDVVGKRKYFLGFSGSLVAISIALVIILGLKPGIDLEGGTQWQIAFSNGGATAAEIQSVIQGTNISNKDVSVKQESDGTFTVRAHTLTEDEHQMLVQALSAKFGTVDEKNYSSIGPSVGAALRTNAIWAIVVVLLGISLYIAYAFRKVSEPVKSWKYGVVTLLTLVHDVSIPTGLLAILGVWKGVEIDTNFIVALLVVMGFSVHDTIVVFDRIRENLLVQRGKKMSLGDIINYSVRETFARSVNTSFTLFLVLVALLFFGPSSLFYFILTILVGTIFGTYSSIFVASPLLYMWQRKQ